MSSALVIGNESLTIQCAEMLIARGHSITALATRSPDVRAWGLAKGLRVEAQDRGLADRLRGMQVDWLLSIANLNVIPDTLLSLASEAVNFHDGPLPRYAGLNAPVWAILNGETQHGITWHKMVAGVDEGDILEQRIFDVSPGDTALTLNTKCFEAAIDSFPALLTALENGAPGQSQDLSLRSEYRRADRPAAAARLDFNQPAQQVVALVRALDHGDYFNPLALPKIVIDGQIILITSAELADGSAAPGIVLDRTDAGLVVACASGAVRLAGLRDLDGKMIDPRTLGTDLIEGAGPDAQQITDAIAVVSRFEGAQRRALTVMESVALPSASEAKGNAVWQTQPLGLPENRALFVLSVGALRATGKTSGDLAFGAQGTSPYLSNWSPLHIDLSGTIAEAEAAFDKALTAAQQRPGFAIDLPQRDPALRELKTPHIGISSTDAIVEGSVITLTPKALHFDESRLKRSDAEAIAARLAVVAEALDVTTPDTSCSCLPVIPQAEADLILNQWNSTVEDYDRELTMHQAFEAQVAKTPSATALVFEGQSLSYALLNARANRAAHVLIEMGVRPGTVVGLCLTRSVDLLVGALAILKAGGAYVPMDPAYPSDRIALFIDDSAASVIVTQSALADDLPTRGAQTLALDADPRLAEAPEDNPDSGATAADLAYMIYTSGSTGRPKGVMVEHRNVVNFFTGMDGRIDHAEGSVWLAVTSLSFDISVLELFWTLARGFKLVISSDEDRALVSSGRISSGKGMEFSLYYWGNDDGVGPKKYEMLLEGAKFADAHGFCAVWTPERHFHAFGGPYPNPSVTGAAVAAVTKNIGVRAGSCVAPLHHPARIAEEWGIIDNLTNGRAGLAMASGWQPDDFLLRPENTPPNNRQALFDSIDQVRRLWRGEKVEFPTAIGTHGVVTQPRPVSKELPVWVTTAGNPATWREAGEIGANVLTHLLGQSVDEVGDKIKIYHDALRNAGHDPADFSVTLMLHTYIARDRELARNVAREPMKDYLRAAAGLIKQYAWAFPAFKKPPGVENPMQIDLQTLSHEENEAILDFAFKRYFEDSGLFGTVDDCLNRVESLKRIGVTEVACLIDYGIAPEKVMEGLYPLAEVLRRSNAIAGPEEGDYSIAAQLIRHKVSHLQCTPSMARMIAMNDDSRMALSGVKNLMLGGEALPSALVKDLQKATAAKIENMYGPTETTIWSTTETAQPGQGVVNIGKPIANTQVYVLDEMQQLVPIGVTGELWIGGEGVTRGYWQRDDLTAERFRDNPFHKGRMYRTGDLVRWRSDGKLDFLGRLDHQVKLRGYRIELGEIETVLEAQPGIAQAVVLAREDVPGDLRLVAYLRGTTDEAALRAVLAGLLPEHMVPAHFVYLEAFPLTPNRKVDRNALPLPVKAEPVAEAYVAPQGVAEQLATVWQRVLGVSKVGAKDNFFALGGHSLLAVQAHREIRADLGAAKLSITDIFRFPVLEALATHIEKSMGSSNRPINAPTVEQSAPNDRADARADAMARRRAMRAGRAAG